MSRTIHPIAPETATDKKSSWKPLLWLLGLTVLVYVTMLVFYELPGLSRNRLSRELFLWPSLIALVFSYWKGYQLLGRMKPSARLPVVIAVAGAALAVLCMFVEPFHSTDMFGYMNRGWQQFHYHMNPYVHTVDDIPGWGTDGMITDHWVNNPSPYGFLFMQITKGIAALGDGSRWWTILLFKGLNVLTHGAIALLLWLTARKINLPRPDRILFLYLFNPLILMHAIANGHNDILMAAFLMLGTYLAAMGAWLWVIPALVTSALIKYASAVVIPLALLYVYRQKGWKTALGSCLLGGLMFLLVGSPYLGDVQQFQFAEVGRNASLTHNSLHAVFYNLFKTATLPFPDIYAHRETVKQLTKGALYLGFLGFFLMQCGRLLKTRIRSFEQFIEVAVWMQFILICVASPKFYAWYLAMFFPMALLLKEGRWLRRLTVLCSATLMLSFTFLGQSHIINYILMVGLPLIWITRERMQRRKAVSVVPHPALDSDKVELITSKV